MVGSSGRRWGGGGAVVGGGGQWWAADSGGRSWGVDSGGCGCSMMDGRHCGSGAAIRAAVAAAAAAAPHILAHFAVWVGGVGRDVFLRGEADEAVLVRVRAQRVVARHEHVDAQVELAVVDEEGPVNVLLRDGWR